MRLLRFAPDGSQLAAVRSDSVLLVFDSKSGETLGQYRGGFLVGGSDPYSEIEGVGATEIVGFVAPGKFDFHPDHKSIQLFRVIVPGFAELQSKLWTPSLAELIQQEEEEEEIDIAEGCMASTSPDGLHVAVAVGGMEYTYTCVVSMLTGTTLMTVSAYEESPFRRYSDILPVWGPYGHTHLVAASALLIAVLDQTERFLPHHCDFEPYKGAEHIGGTDRHVLAAVAFSPEADPLAIKFRFELEEKENSWDRHGWYSYRHCTGLFDLKTMTSQHECENMTFDCFVGHARQVVMIVELADPSRDYYVYVPGYW